MTFTTEFWSLMEWKTAARKRKTAFTWNRLAVEED